MWINALSYSSNLSLLVQDPIVLSINREKADFRIIWPPDL